MRARAPVLFAWLLISAALLLGALPDIDRLGLYYDEAFMAQQARDFTMPERRVQHPGSVRSVEVFGRPFPLRNAAYLGALKSQLLIPAFEVFGSSVRVLRTTTLAYALLAVLCTMLAVRRLFDARAAILSGVLLASDPSFYFYSQFEWGPFTTNLLCRCLGLLLLLAAWQSEAPKRSAALAAGAGAVLGLGVFSRADFGLILAAAGLALLVCRRDLVVTAWTQRRAAVLAGAAALLLTSLPMLASLLALLTTSSEIADRGDLGFKLRVLWHSLDGSQFHRVMQTGGLFDATPEVGVGGTPLPWLALLACAFLLVLWRRRGSDETPADPRAYAWLVATLALITLGTVAMPGAVRAHHQLNGMPLPHIVLACALVAAWERPLASPRARVVSRAGVGAVVAILLVANASVIVGTHETLRETGGRGRWTNALAPLARQLDAESGSIGISLDWGFHEPLLFLTERARLAEAIWSIPQTLRSGRPWVHNAGAETLYFVHTEPWDLFGLGPDFLAAVARLDPNDVEQRVHRDAEGKPAFITVRIRRPHRLVHTGRFRIE